MTGGLLKPAENGTAKAKVGMLGFAGSGKSYTAVDIAIGLAKEYGDGKPIAYFDTENGSDWLKAKVEAAGLELVVAKSRAFVDLMKVVDEAEATCSVLVIDSISHVWSELLEAYKRRKRRTYISFPDWGVLKPEWAKFTDRFLSSDLHIVMCGRAGWEYDERDNDEGGTTLTKIGTKMKGETEMGYEPSLLLEMVRMRKSDVTGDPETKGWTIRAVVLKDRADMINGAEFDDPTFADFAPHWAALGEGAHRGVGSSTTSEDLFEDRDRSASHRKKLVDIRLEEIQEALTLAGLESRSKDGKKKLTEELIKAFGTSSWTAISAKELEDLEYGLDQLRINLGQKEDETGQFGEATDKELRELSALIETATRAKVLGKSEAAAMLSVAIERDGEKVREAISGLTDRIDNAPAPEAA